MRYLYKYLGKPFTLIILFIILLIGFYLYLYSLEIHFNSSHVSSERCVSELKSLKYQLNVVTEYKDKIDNLLTQIQTECEENKEKLKDVIESCIGLGQQSALCQTHFDDLKDECIKVKKDYDKLKGETDKFKIGRS